MKSLHTSFGGPKKKDNSFDGRISADKKGIAKRKQGKDKRKRDISFLTARNKHKRMKYSNDEAQNDRLFLERCKHLVRIASAGF